MLKMIDRKCKLFFFVGTEAELIKLFPIMLEFKRQKITFCMIASGQNDITKSKLLDIVGREYLKLELSKESSIRKTTFGLLVWWGHTFLCAKKKFKERFKNVDFSDSIMLVHGDTVSTVMGALLGKRLKMRVAHVEAGLRSHDYFNPFPEEIDRMITSRFANIHYAPGTEATQNLIRAKGDVINTKYNTIYDSLLYSYQMPSDNKLVNKLIGQKYCVFVLHRQENLSNRALVEMITAQMLKASKTLMCVLLMHKPTEVWLQKYNLLDQIKSIDEVVVTSRMEYFDFMKVLNGAQFIITDGGSNQEELSYMGKPCMIIRETTERNDGLGENAVLWEKSEDNIERFIVEYKRYERESLVLDESPSVSICADIRNRIYMK